MIASNDAENERLDDRITSECGMSCILKLVSMHILMFGQQRRVKP